MKVLQVIPYFSPKFGGDVNVCIKISQELVKRENEVTIITTDFGFDSKYADTIRKKGVQVIPLPCIANFGLFLFSPSLKHWLEKNLKDFDIIHLHNYRSYQNVVTHKYAMKQGIPYILQTHGSILPFFEKQNLKKLYDLIWGETILKNSSKLIAVSKVEKEQFLKIGIPVNKIDIIPNGIDVSEYETLPERGKFRKKYGIGSDEKTILYLGRLHKSKGLEFLITGFSNLLDQHQDFKLVIAGPDDGFLDTLIKQIKELKIDENVFVTGPLYKNEKLEAFVDTDVLVYPESIEIFGLVPFEAIMCGTPVIVTDDCGCGEIIKEADCGYLVKFGDIAGLSTRMSEVLINPHNSYKKVKCGQLYIKENLSYGRVINRFLKLYNSCLLVKNNF